MAKVSEIPVAIRSFGDRADGRSVEVWWPTAHPFSSSLIGQRSAELAPEFSQQAGKPWLMSLGFKHSMFEFAIDALS